MATAHKKNMVADMDKSNSKQVSIREVQSTYQCWPDRLNLTLEWSDRWYDKNRQSKKIEIIDKSLKMQAKAICNYDCIKDDPIEELMYLYRFNLVFRSYSFHFLVWLSDIIKQ